MEPNKKSIPMWVNAVGAVMMAICIFVGHKFYGKPGLIAGPIVGIVIFGILATIAEKSGK